MATIMAFCNVNQFKKLSVAYLRDGSRRRHLGDAPASITSLFELETRKHAIPVSPDSRLRTRGGK